MLFVVVYACMGVCDPTTVRNCKIRAAYSPDGGESLLELGVIALETLSLGGAHHDGATAAVHASGARGQGHATEHRVG